MPTDRLKSRVVALLGGACQRCGYDRCLRALHLHHLDPATKEHRSSQGTILRQAERNPELFILLCANCHIEEHVAQDQARQPTATCVICGTEYRIGAYVAKLGRTRYCSRACKTKSLIGRPSFNPYAKAYAEARKSMGQR